jgi:signal transduction histidine kinase
VARVTAGRLLDAGIAAVVTTVGVAEIWVPLPSVMGSGSRVASTVVVVLMGSLLVLRRRWPLPVAVAVLWTWPLVFMVEPLLVLFWGQFVPMAVAVFSIARYGRDREPWLGAAAGAATLLFFDLRVAALQDAGEIVFHWMVFVVAWSFGWGLRRMERRARESTQRAIDAEVAAAEQAMQAVVAERTRIARELHDVIAHSVSVMVVQAGAAEQVVGEDDETVRRALRTVRSTGTEALAEMRRVVAMIRDDEEGGSLTPQPGVDALPGLVSKASESGLQVSLAVEGDARPLPPGLDLAAYRIVQEALTNVRRHARAASAWVVLRYGDDGVDIEVVDDGAGAGEHGGVPVGGGHGLVGMRERVSLYGGRLEAASQPGGGFAVRARLPVVVS